MSTEQAIRFANQEVEDLFRRWSEILRSSATEFVRGNLPHYGPGDYTILQASFSGSRVVLHIQGPKDYMQFESLFYQDGGGGPAPTRQTDRVRSTKKRSPMEVNWGGVGLRLLNDYVRWIFDFWSEIEGRDATQMLANHLGQRTGKGEYQVLEARWMESSSSVWLIVSGPGSLQNEYVIRIENAV